MEENQVYAQLERMALAFADYMTQSIDMSQIERKKSSVVIE
jgi:hypothetical protein